MGSPLRLAIVVGAAWQALVRGGPGEAPSRPCAYCPLPAARKFADLVGGLLGSFHTYSEQPTTAIPERMLMLLGRNLVDAAIQLIEAVYALLSILLTCGPCGTERDLPAVEQLISSRFDAMVSCLAIFAELVESTLEGHERQNRGEDSPLLQRLGTAAGLRKFGEEFAPARGQSTFALAAMEMAALRLTGEAGDFKEAFEVLEAGLRSMSKYVASALGLVPDLLIDSRRLPGLTHSWSFEVYYRGMVNTSSFSNILAFTHTLAYLEHPFTRSSMLCEDVPAARLFHGVHRLHGTQAATPPPDHPYVGASGFLTWHGMSPRALLERIASAGHGIRYTDWAVRHQAFFQKTVCAEAYGMLYDPSVCLEEEDGWGSITYHVDPHPSAKNPLFVQYQGRACKGKRLTENFIWSPTATIVPPNAPMDILVFSPLVGNCRRVRELLMADSTTTVKLVYAPFNPLLPPPVVVRPNFTEFWGGFYEEEKPLPGETEDMALRRHMVDSGRPLLAQCSLTALAEDLAPLAYELLFVDHHFAIFAHSAVLPVFGQHPGTPAKMLQEWRWGWFCSPLSRYLVGLEEGSELTLAEVYPDPMVPGDAARVACLFLERHGLASPAIWRDHGCEGLSPAAAAPPPPSAADSEWKAAEPVEDMSLGLARRARRLLWAHEMRGPVPGLRHTLARSGRATCQPDGLVCDCLVPFRGPTCSAEEPGKRDASRPYRAAVHFIVNEDAEHLAELLYALGNLYDAFNAEADYPVLIFHDGLSDDTREKITLRANNRIWFFQVHEWAPNTDAAGIVQESRGDHTEGYRAQSRFRAGPFFEHPGARDFDYLWGLDTDSHFPGPVEEDPFEHMHANPDLVMGYRYVTKTAPASAINLWDYTVLYAMEQGIDVRAPEAEKQHFMANISILVPGYESSAHWTHNVIMTDCEVLRTSFFRQGTRYGDYFNYLDSLQGFWRYRWGDHAVRGLGVALALWEEDAPTWRENSTRQGRGGTEWPRVFVMGLPYAHQNFCQCGGGPGARRCVVLHDPKAGKLAPEDQVPQPQPPRVKLWTCAPAVAPGQRGSDSAAPLPESDSVAWVRGARGR